MDYHHGLLWIIYPIYGGLSWIIHEPNPYSMNQGFNP